MVRKRWKLADTDPGAAERLTEKLGILPATARLLVNRGITDPDRALGFMRPDLRDLHDPFLLKDMDRAVDRIVRALHRDEKITVYGDYDVDGTTSAALLALFFRDIGVEASTFIPDRKDGYGLGSEAIKKLHASGTTLIITVDCGVSDFEEISYASELGLDVIVTDHHEPTRGIPPAHAVVNPKRGDCPFPFKGLAGVGVAFNLVMAVRARLREVDWTKGELPNLKRYLDLVSIGTIADVVPLVDENRVFASYGLRELQETERPGLVALKEASSLKPGRLSSTDVAFRLAPRINAAGRLERASTALALLTSSTGAEARALASELERGNRERQKIEEGILRQAEEMARGADPAERGLVLFSEGWHPGVIGIVASRLVDRFSRPAVLLSLADGVAKGSARGIKAFDMIEGLKHCSTLIDRFGGHKAAAGLTLATERVEAFRRKFLSYANDALTDEDLTPELSLDGELSLGEVNDRLVSEIETLAPFGCANREPLFCVQSARLTKADIVGTNHLMFTASQDGAARAGIGFGLGGLKPLASSGVVSIAFRPYIDEWRGTRRLRLRAKDIQAPDHST